MHSAAKKMSQTLFDKEEKREHPFRIKKPSDREEKPDISSMDNINKLHNFWDTNRNGERIRVK